MIAQITTHFLADPSLRTERGEMSCKKAPTTIGRTLKRPEETSSKPRANAKATIKVSPAPTIKLNVAASITLYFNVLSSRAACVSALIIRDLLYTKDRT